MKSLIFNWTKNMFTVLQCNNNNSMIILINASYERNQCWVWKKNTNNKYNIFHDLLVKYDFGWFWYMITRL